MSRLVVRLLELRRGELEGRRELVERELTTQSLLRYQREDLDTLLGQIVTSYGRRDYAHTDGISPFVQLLERVSAIDGIERIRFTSPHPRGFKQDLVEAYGRLPKLCPYVHLPLQSGSNRILKAMNRPYTRERFDASNYALAYVVQYY